MSSYRDWIDSFRCPDCQGAFSFTAFPDQARSRRSVGAAHPPSARTAGARSTASRTHDEDAVRYGLLQCRCFRYPVVDGVPILLKGNVGLFDQGGAFESKGPAVDEIAALVEQGLGSEALVGCLGFAPRFELLDKLPGWRLWHSDAVKAFGRRAVEARLRAMLSRDRRELSAEDWFEFYFGGSTASDPNHLPYYRNRVVLPRTLAAFSLLRLLPPADKPILDVACGYGPFAHYLTKRRNSTPVIGFDFNFYLVWGQKYWIAPDAVFVCADGNKRLPFAEDTFSAVFCSDAFMYLKDKPGLLAEIDRCAPGKPVILSRVGNKTASPREVRGDSHSAEGYMELLASGRPRIFSEYALVRHYLSQRNPVASETTNPRDLRWDKWLHFLLNGESLRHAVLDSALEWPHRVGKLSLSPLFERKVTASGRFRLDFNFPTIWFAYQNGDMYGYHGDQIECSPDVVERARAGIIDPEVQSLLDRFVVIGMPDRYLKAGH
jgi:SAM-dependent methyltransferase